MITRTPLLLLAVLAIAFSQPQCGTGNDAALPGMAPEGMSCSTHADCIDASPCTTDRCENGRCAYSILWLDKDGDEYLSPECGGQDCNDSDPDVHPGSWEGPYDDWTCADGLDNNCDGLSDWDDPVCEDPGTASGGCDDSCCKCCTVGQACGDACISMEYTCHQPPGCACNSTGPPPQPCPAGCCKCCRVGKACGNTCIARAEVCHEPRGCACDAP